MHAYVRRTSADLRQPDTWLLRTGQHSRNGITMILKTFVAHPKPRSLTTFHVSISASSQPCKLYTIRIVYPRYSYIPITPSNDMSYPPALRLVPIPFHSFRPFKSRQLDQEFRLSWSIPTISYPPSPSLPLPRPRPLENPSPSSSSPVPPFCAAPSPLLPAPPPAFPPPPPPNDIGLSSRYLDPQMARATQMPELAAMAPHHIAFRGMRPVYRLVTTRCRPCIVSAKSGTSFERPMRTMIATALLICVSAGLQALAFARSFPFSLHPVSPQAPRSHKPPAQKSRMKDVTKGNNSHAEPPIKNPQESSQPPLRRISPNSLPPKNKIQREPRTSDERREEHQHQRPGIVQSL